MPAITPHTRYLTCAVLMTMLFCAPRVTQTHHKGDPDTLTQGRFLPGDALRISTPLDTVSFLCGDYPIDGNGFAYLPILGNIQVTNKTPEELTDYIRTTLEEYLRYPEIQAQPLIRASLQGGFAIPGFYYIEPERSMWDLVARGGGTTSEKGIRNMVWVRRDGNTQSNCLPHLESGESLIKIGFRSGDQLLTPVDTRTPVEKLVTVILPIATFGLSLFLGIIAVMQD